MSSLQSATPSIDFNRDMLAAIGELGAVLSSTDDLYTTAPDAAKFLKAAAEFLDNLGHPLDCPRNRDDVDCTCSIWAVRDQIDEWVDEYKRLAALKASAGARLRACICTPFHDAHDPNCPAVYPSGSADDWPPPCGCNGKCRKARGEALPDGAECAADIQDRG